MNLVSEQRFFERWFDLLAKHKFGAALLPLSGMSIGFFLTLSVHVMPTDFSWFIGALGVSMLAICGVLYLSVSVIHLVLWIKKA